MIAPTPLIAHIHVQAVRQFLADSHAGVKLDWVSPVISLSAAASDSSCAAVFHFKNPSDRPIIIKEVRPSSSCVLAELKQKTYLPGESGSLKFKVDLGSTIGELDKEIIVITSDGNLDATTKLGIRVDVKGS